MRFIHADKAEDGAMSLAGRIVKELGAGRRVLWLVCGGSSISTIALAMNEVERATKARGVSLDKLVVSLTDERYGRPGHPDSNWKQLIDAGFDIATVRTLPVLTGGSLGDTVASYSKALSGAVTEADIVVAVFGIGADGHIAGILPHSSAADEGISEYAFGYEAPPLTRITMTFLAIKDVDVAYAFVFGDAKKSALERLRDEMLDLAEQPSQILKSLPEAYVYTDAL
ncbi:MAG: 6-phosphogluconolactonase [Patescibacteria group bacterium]|nr:6-phosphogluconolactonase [Patescibacteria group bacterium]